MASTTPTSKSEAPARTCPAPSAPTPWWRRCWSEPVVAVTVIVALVTALVTGEMAMFQSLKGDIHSLRDDVASDIRSLKAEVASEVGSLKADMNASEARLMETVRLSEIRQNTRLNEVRAERKEDVAERKADNASLREELKEEIRAMGDKLDRVLETLLAAKT